MRAISQHHTDPEREKNMLLYVLINVILENSRSKSSNRSMKNKWSSLAEFFANLPIVHHNLNKSHVWFR